MNNKFITEDEQSVFPLCNSCKYHEYGLKCRAFDIIPDSILGNDIKHDSVIPGQKESVVYEEKEMISESKIKSYIKNLKMNSEEEMIFRERLQWTSGNFQAAVFIILAERGEEIRDVIDSNEEPSAEADGLT